MWNDHGLFWHYQTSETEQWNEFFRKSINSNFNFDREKGRVKFLRDWKFLLS